MIDEVLTANRFIHKIIMAADDDPMVTLILPGHRIATDHPIAAFGVLFDRENKILHDSNILVDADIDRTQLANDDLGRFRPEPDPFVQPWLIDIDRAFMAEADKVVVNIF